MLARARSCLFAVLCLAAGAAAAQQLFPEPELAPDGLWAEAWLRPPSGDLRADLAAAADEGRILALFWEDPGCEYCARLHQVALRIPALRNYVANRFYSVRVERFGAKPLVDFDGTESTESEVAIRHSVEGTPAIEFRLANGIEVYRGPRLCRAAGSASAVRVCPRGRLSAHQRHPMAPRPQPAVAV